MCHSIYHLNLPSIITVTGKGTITYTYDAAGNKLNKITLESNATVLFNNVNYTTNITTTTQYITGFAYESKAYSNPTLASLQYTDVLQFTSHEEGRIRRKTDGTFAFDYFLKDHLGNVRMVVTEQQQTDIYPAASLETSNVALEQNYYNITSGQIVDKTAVTGLPAYVNHNIIPNNPVNPTFDNANSAKLYKLNKNSQNIGLGITLKVMTGDKLDIYGKSYYFQNNTGGTAANTAVTTLQLLTGLLGGPTGGATAVHGAVTSSQLNGIPATTGLINTLLGTQTTTNNATPLVPKAFINYILFDEQFKCVATGFAPLGANSALTDYGTNPALHNIPVTKNGFVYIYCSNESPIDVFFDNLQVMHTKGAILEETSYYPFGLTMAGISSQAAGGIQNRYKFNGGTELQSGEFSDGSGLELYATQYRSLDPQLGRFWQLDPIDGLSHNASLYSFGSNNPILLNDPLGLWNDSTKTNTGEMAYANQPWNEGVVVKGKSKATPFYWPEIRKDQGKWSDEMFVRQRDDKPLVQGNEPPWILNNLDFYKKVYQNELDYRKNQIVVVLILMSPLILEATPELLAALQEEAALANEALTDVGTYLQYELEVGGVKGVITANELRAKISQVVVRVLSKYKLAKYSTLKNILNSGRNYKSAGELFKAAKKTYDNIKQIKKFFGL